MNSSVLATRLGSDFESAEKSDHGASNTVLCHGLRDRKNPPELAFSDESLFDKGFQSDQVVQCAMVLRKNALYLCHQIFGLKHMDQPAIHHPLEGLTQGAREHNRPIVKRIRGILPGFWNWNHRRLPPRWGDVPVVQMLLKRLRRISRQDSGR
ncbi:hypothetical protein PoB_002146700 [Plakobranchus ocellatus]|uniref:Uncharacterized protein n=1 Tax=Plakobranchus ocellatus TaxID=259542 RepID=A0AAV3ZK83_9GAST|nr:hypothetical protein PoB_002146700 [Plakobranchus ocellatus]